MIFSVTWKDLRFDSERNIFEFDVKHPTTGEELHIEQSLVSKASYDAVQAEIDIHMVAIEELMNTVIEVEIATPFQASVAKSKLVVNKHSYSKATTIDEVK